VTRIVFPPPPQRLPFAQSNRTSSALRVPRVGSTKNNPPAAKSGRTGTHQIEGPVHLIGPHRWPTAEITTGVVAKIFAAELGVPANMLVSTDGIVTTSIPRRRS
jgi:hypothetical protein